MTSAARQILRPLQPMSLTVQDKHIPAPDSHIQVLALHKPAAAPLLLEAAGLARLDRQ